MTFRISKDRVPGEQYFGNASDILITILLRETQILVQPKPHIVAVKAVGGQSDMKQMLLKGGCHSRLAGGGQSGKPDGKPTLPAQLVALFPRK